MSGYLDSRPWCKGLLTIGIKDEPLIVKSYVMRKTDEIIEKIIGGNRLPPRGDTNE